MRRAGPWALYAVLLAAAAALTVVAHDQKRADSPVPSVDNPGPLGVRALSVLLAERGTPSIALREPLTDLPTPAASVVLVAPAERAVQSAEVDRLRRFVEAGGTLVYLTPRPLGRETAALDRWLRLEQAGLLRTTGSVAASASDPMGAPVGVKYPKGPLTGAKTLRFSRASGIRSSAPGALPVAAQGDAVAGWFLPIGRGRVWIFAGPDLAENRRLERADNLAFWIGLAAEGPIAFDEWHHQVGASAPISRSLGWIALQIVACVLAFGAARGSRFGPPRPVRVERHRSTREYLESFAWLTRRARVEPELVRELGSRFRVLLWDGLGVPVELPDADAAREAEARAHLPPGQLAALLAEVRATGSSGKVSPAHYARLSAELARLERQISGRGA